MHTDHRPFECSITPPATIQSPTRTTVLCLLHPTTPITPGKLVYQNGYGVSVNPQLSYSLTMWQAHELDQKIQDVYKRIQTERKVLEASRILSQATTNPDVLRKNDAAIREAERSISYFEDTLRELQSRKMMQSQRADHSRSGSFGSQVRIPLFIPPMLAH